MLPSKLIPAADRERIEAAVRTAEAETTGEIVVSVVRSSSRHNAAPWRLGVALAALALLGSSALPIAGAFPQLPGPQLLGLQALALIMGHTLCRWDPLRRAFTPESELEEKVNLAALRSFGEHGITHTAERTGILIFVSLLEHRVVVLGDEAVDSVLAPEESWSDVVELVLLGIKRGEPVEGIIEAVERCGRILSQPLPARDENPDELPHGLILSD